MNFFISRRRDNLNEATIRALMTMHTYERKPEFLDDCYKFLKLRKHTNESANKRHKFGL